MYRRREGRGTDSSNETRLLTNLTNRTITFGDIDNLELLPKRTIDLLRIASIQRIGSSVDLKTAVNQGWVIFKDRKKQQVEKKDICDAIIPAVLKDAREEEIVRNITTVTSNYTANDDDDDIILVDATATITLPSADDIKGHHLIVKNIKLGATVTVDDDGSETIDGELTQLITDQYTSLTFISDGSNWFII